eukprot:5294659-Ditylum_brightwellii.AAC.1
MKKWFKKQEEAINERFDCLCEQMEESQKTLMLTLDEKTKEQKITMDALVNSINILTQFMEMNQEYIKAMKHKLGIEESNNVGDSNKRTKVGVDDNILDEDKEEKRIQCRCKEQQGRGNQEIFRNKPRKIKKKLWEERVSV